MQHLLASYGYWAVGGSIALESTGLPVPAETILVAVALAAGTTHSLNIALVVAAAASGAILGAIIGFWVGRQFGYRLLLRYGRYVGFTEPRIKLGQYLFLRHGGKVVFFGRFVSVLRTLAAVLAGLNAMSWRRFLVFNAVGGIVWAALYGLGAYYFGHVLAHLHRPLSVALGILGAVLAIASIVFVKRHQPALERKAEQALPGPLPRWEPSTGKDGTNG